MLSMPHAPTVESFPCMRHMAQIVIDESDKDLKAKFRKGDGAFFKALGHQWMILGLLSYLNEEPRARVWEQLRKGVEYFRTGIELRSKLNAWEMWDFFLYAVALDDLATARLIAVLPNPWWWDTEIKPVPWLVKQVQAVFALFRRDTRSLPTLLRDLRVMVFEEALPEELELEVPDIRNTCQMLEALDKADGSSFNACLRRRMEFRALHFRETIAPIGLLDLQALGLCRLARERNMTVDVRHVYLPLDLLDLRPEPESKA